MNREEFYNVAREQLQNISEAAVEGCESILDEAERRSTPTNQLAYILATAWWETARTMQPVREAFFVAPNNFAKAEKWRKKNLHYYPYYGRGYVQLTWKANYDKASKKLGQDFVGEPDLVMRPEYAVPIMFDGMEEGWFTGKALDDYIDEVDEPESEDLKEYIQARRIINGTNKAQTIGKLALSFERALRAAGYQIAGAAITVSAGQAATTSSAFEQLVASFGLRHFKPYELLVKGSSHTKSGSKAHGLNTDPPKALWNNIRLTAQVLDELRHRLERPIIMLSVYRSPAYNEAIGGATKSQHVEFNAIDFAVQGSPVGPSQWAAPLREMRADGKFKGGIGIYSTFVHVDTRGQNADWTG